MPRLEDVRLLHQSSIRGEIPLRERQRGRKGTLHSEQLEKDAMVTSLSFTSCPLLAIVVSYFILHPFPIITVANTELNTVDIY